MKLTVLGSPEAKLIEEQTQGGAFRKHIITIETEPELVVVEHPDLLPEGGVVLLDIIKSWGKHETR